MRCVHTFDLGKSAPLAEEAFRAFLRETSTGGDRLLALFAEEPSSGRFLLHAVAGGGAPGQFVYAWMEASPCSFRTFTDVCPGTHWFEREIYDLFGLVPEGHPELNPLRFHEAWSKKFFPLRSAGSPVPDPRRGYRFLLVRGRGSTRWRWGRSTPGSSNRGTSAFPAPERRSRTLRSASVTSTRGSSRSSLAVRGWGSSSYPSRSPGTPPWGTRPRAPASSRRSRECPRTRPRSDGAPSRSRSNGSRTIAGTSGGSRPTSGSCSGRPTSDDCAARR